MNNNSEWDKAYFYEFRVVRSTDSSDIKREFRCPVCYSPLREGLGASDANPKEQMAGEGWDDPKTGIGPEALMCPKSTCRAYFKLTM